MNAKTELLSHTKQGEILCCEINIITNNIRSFDNDDASNNSILTTGYTTNEWNDFLSLIDVEYDSGYGSQNLHGTIWYKDGTWSTRGEYDGSEWWEYHCVPPIPENLNRVDKVRDEKLNKIL